MPLYDGTAIDDTLVGGAEDDILRGWGGSDLLQGGAGRDLLLDEGSFGPYGKAADTLDGGAGDDTLRSYGGGDLLDGGDGNDLVEDLTGNVIAPSADTLLGGAGNDTLRSGFGNDLLDGGDGDDLLRWTVSFGAPGTATLLGGSGNDTLEVAPQDGALVDAGDGVDLIVLNGESALSTSTVWSGAGADTLQLTAREPIGVEAFSVADFDTGPGGDRIDVDLLLAASSAYSGGNPFAPGSVLRLVADGADTLLQFDFDGAASRYGWQVVLRLEGLAPDELSGAQFNGGYVPRIATPELLFVGTSGSDVLVGNPLDNLLQGLGGWEDALYGLGGNDTLDGGPGYNTLVGGAGDDVYLVGPQDVSSVVESAGGGFDEIRTYLDLYFMPANVERVVLLGAQNLSAGGSAGSQELIGNDGANVLDGRAGVDTLSGGDGDDSLYTTAGDLVTGGTGRDVVTIGVPSAGAAWVTVTDFAAGAGGDRLALVELVYQAHLAGSAYGPPSDPEVGILRLVQIGADTRVDWDADGAALRGFGWQTVALLQGVQAETLVAGNFILPTDAPLLVAPDPIEGGDGDDALDGAADADLLRGYAGNDTLQGFAGDDTLVGQAGNDQLVGGDGNDTYIVEQSGDLVVEDGTVASDSDEVRSAVDYVLGDGLENLLLRGAAAQQGTGNALSNRLTGNDANNLLRGLAGADLLLGGNGVDTLDGGAGADTMQGGAGGDLFVIDDDGDVILGEANPEDRQWDGVQTARSWTLAPDFYRLILTGSDAADGTGNAGLNWIIGNAGANRLDGGGGTDQLDGGAGDDTLIGQGAADQLAGGAGDDTYLLPDGSVAHTLVEEAGPAGGIDVVVTSTSHALESFIENLVMTGAALFGSGNTLSNRITGNAGGNDLGGYEGDDTLDGGAGADSLFGDTGNDLLLGGDGNDVLVGRGGSDSMEGGSGNDLYVVDATNDLVVEQVDAGQDSVSSSVDHLLRENFENLSFTGSAGRVGTGNTLANVLSGTAGDDGLSGVAGADTLMGFGGADTLDGGTGVDSMDGGLGNDLYIVDDAGDVLVEAADGGADSVQASITFQLAASFENLVLIGSAALDGAGNAVANRISGNAGANALGGEAGDDTLLGNAGLDTLDGGTGADSMVGGSGTDSYVVDAAGDIVVETDTSTAEIDMVHSAVSWSLGANVEWLQLTGDAATSGIGNAAANRITGNAAANGLHGALGNDTLLGDAGNDTLDGGAGADALTGGTGNDTYVVDTLADVIVEVADGGIDTVRSGVTLTLANQLEHLVLTGSLAIGGTGNALANKLTGNSAANVLNGGAGRDNLTGGAGNDTLDGGTGDDTLAGGSGADVYLVDSAGDSVVESSTVAGEVDAVRSRVSIVLGDNLEVLELLGTGATQATGNTLANRLVGNTAANVLNGLAGADTLTGGAGADTFRFTAAPGSGVDRITDFSAVDDRIQLDDAAFAGIGPLGALAAAAFATGTAAKDASDRVVYDQASGALRYDADGLGGAAAVLFAQLNPGTALSVADLFVV